MISEYEIGRYGWLMRLAFTSLGISLLSLLVVLWQQTTLIAEMILTIDAISLIGAAVFISDPITTPRKSITSTGKLHTLFGVLFIFGFPVTTTILGLSLGNSILLQFKTLLVLMSVFVWVGFIVFMSASAIFGGKEAKRGPTVKIGWPNRFMMLTYVMWIIVVSYLIG